MALRRMKAWRKGVRHLPKKQFFQRLKRKLIGHYNDYDVRGHRGHLALRVVVLRSGDPECETVAGSQEPAQQQQLEKFNRALKYAGIPKPRPTEKRRLHQVALR
jgi:hypothetical protein